MDLDKRRTEKERDFFECVMDIIGSGWQCVLYVCVSELKRARSERKKEK